MNWDEIKTAVIDEIKNSNSGNATAKIQALQKIETILEQIEREHFTDIASDNRD